MVARPESGGPMGPPRGSDPVGGLFLTWRRIVTAAMRAPGRAKRSACAFRAAEVVRLGSRYARDPVGTLLAADAPSRKRLKEAGAVALALGAALAFAVSSAVGEPLVRRFLALGWTAAWALVRLLIMRLAARPASTTETRRVDDAWGPALLPYLAAIVFPLDLAALALSAYLSYRGMSALGASRAQTRRAVAWAFGGQLVAETIAWAGRGGLLAFAAFGS